MAKWSLSLVLLLVFFGGVALAQPIYQWKDEKGQWHFSNSLPPGVAAQKIMEGTPAPEAALVVPNTQPGASPSADSESGEKAVSKLPTAPASDVSPGSSDRRWLLIFPPITQAETDNRKRFSGWTPAQVFDSDEACNRYKAILIGNSYSLSDGVSSVNFQLLNSNCIPAAEFITGKEADVTVVTTQFEPVTVGFSSLLLSGKVFNRGQATARNVVTKYQIRDANGSIMMQGEVPTSPDEIPGLTFAEFRTPSIGGWSLSGLSVQAEADWAKK
jgi:hypothetical protein